MSEVGARTGARLSRVDGVVEVDLTDSATGHAPVAHRRPVPRVRDVEPPPRHLPVDVQLLPLRSGAGSRRGSRLPVAFALPRHRDAIRERWRGWRPTTATKVTGILLVVAAVSVSSAWIASRVFASAVVPAAVTTATTATTTTTTAGEAGTNPKITPTGSDSADAAPPVPAHASARVVSPKAGAAVSTCPSLSGRAAGLSSRDTLVLAVSDPARSSRLSLAPVNGWRDPSTLQRWSGRLALGGQEVNRDVVVRVVEMPLTAVRAALAGSSSDSAWTVAKLPASAVQRDSVEVSVQAGDTAGCTASP